MKFAKAPSYEEAVKILREITSKPAKKAARKIDKPLALYGTGKLGKMAIELLEHIGMPPDIVVDKNPDGCRGDAFWQGRTIVAADQVSIEIRKSHMLAVSIATLPYEELEAILASEGWVDIVPFYDVAEAYRNIYPLSNGWVLDQFDEVDAEATCKVLEGWTDDISRAHHLQFIAWHALREDWLFDDAPVTMGDRYFIPEVVSLLGGNEIFCDIGAHQAEVILRFLQASGNQFKEICAIEPDVENMNQLRAELQKLEPETANKIKVLACAVAAQEGRGNFFQGLGYASQLSDLGQHALHVTTIDQLGLEPTFLKLHLEGGELDAMKGGVQTVLQCRPIIASTTYHNHLGVWQTPNWLMEHLVDYVFLMRLHSWCGTGSVIYAIPREKYCMPRQEI